jgi:hypothetical protein
MLLSSQNNKVYSSYLSPKTIFESDLGYINKIEDNFQLIAYLNSKFAEYYLSLISPTNYKAGFFELPRIEPDDKLLNNLSRLCISISANIAYYDKLRYDKVSPLVNYYSGKSLKNTFYDFYYGMEEKKILLLELEYLIDKRIFEIFEITLQKQNEIYEKHGRPVCGYPEITYAKKDISGVFNELKIPLDHKTPEMEFFRQIDYNLVADQLIRLWNSIPKEYSRYSEGFKDSLSNLETIESISENNGIHPRSVLELYKNNPEILNNLLLEEVYYLIYQILSEIFIEKNQDINISILKMNKTNNKFLNLFEEKLSEHFGNENLLNVVSEIESILETDLETWIKKKFFGWHYKKYAKKPLILALGSRNLRFFIHYHNISKNNISEIVSLIEDELDYIQLEIENMELNEKITSDDRINLRKYNLDLEDLKKLKSELIKILENGPLNDTFFENGMEYNLKYFEEILSPKTF